MLILYAMLLGFVLDLLFGDPDWLPHPVVAMGKAISRYERVLRPRFGRTPRGELLGGALLAVLLPPLTFGIAFCVCLLARRIHPAAEFVVQSFWCAQALAARGLATESRRVYEALHEGDLFGARKAVARIVGRDVERLDGSKEVMERYGMGICYEKAFDGVRIKEITEELRKNTAVFYREHHRRMNRICMENRRTVLFDLHSFSDEITPVDFLEAGRKTPDLCIGTADTFTPVWLTDIVRTRFEEAGFSTAVNYPYRGCYVPECLSTEESTFSCIPVMLEFNKRSYIKENGFLDDEKVLNIRQVIMDIVSECAVREKHTAF